MSAFIEPNWPAPPTVKAYTTLRSGGFSKAPYHTFNLGTHVGDDSKSVAANRRQLKKILLLPNDPIWIQQTHSTIALAASDHNRGKIADALYSNEPDQICTVLTADCLPILLAQRDGSQVAAIHAGWRGLAHGIIEQTLQAINLPGDTWLAWLGPAISAAHFEVGDEVHTLFIEQNPESSSAFTPSPQGRWLADIYALARLRLVKQNITAIYGGHYCTYSDSEQFYSYRRDGQKTGRMASLIWINHK